MERWQFNTHKTEFWILKFILHTIDIMNKRDLMDTDIENTTGPTEDSMETMSTPESL